MNKNGLIVKGIGGFYYVLIEQDIIECKARGRFRKDGIVPMVGDYVSVDIEKCFIEEILPRKNQLIRPAVANIDYLGIVIAGQNPNPDFLLVDKLMIFAQVQNIRPILIINKIDIAEKKDIDNIVEVYRYTGYTILEISTKYSIGIEEAKHALNKGIITLAGQSGVGKSSLINKLHPPLNLEVGDISQKLKRGRHTTRFVELLSLPYGGMIVDTPGFSAINLQTLTKEEVRNSYPEFNKYENECRFGIDCYHHHEPGCGVKERLGTGIISIDRYERYIKILEQIYENGRRE